MPLYEYECEACHHRFEAIRKFADKALEICPKCGGQIRKLISSPAFHLKGTGWYVTDYAKKENAPKSEADKPADTKAPDASSGAGDGKKAETPPAAKGESGGKTETKADKTTTSDKANG